VPAPRWLARWLTPPLALLLAACTAAETRPPSAEDNAESPFADCAALSAPLAPPSPSAPGPSPADTAASQSPPPADTAAGQAPLAADAVASQPPTGADAAASQPVAANLPDFSLPCFTGAATVRLSELRGPAVINLWGSWCGPCREELPVMQALADATTGRLRVIGVDTRDTRDAAASFAADRGVSFPTLFDPDQRLLGALGRLAVPTTVFIAADGKRFVYTGEGLDKPTLGGLVRTHTGVTVTG
jgi:thiol-disulfide isomerase/thioredoxin